VCPGDLGEEEAGCCACRAAVSSATKTPACSRVIALCYKMVNPVAPPKESRISNPIRLDQALRNSALILLVLWQLRTIPAKPDARQLPDDSCPAVVPAPMQWRQVCYRSQNPVPTPGDSGVRVPPIVLRILPGSTSDTAPFSVKQPQRAGILKCLESLTQTIG
jgi:hypothetical protein